MEQRTAAEWMADEGEKFRAAESAVVAARRRRKREQGRRREGMLLLALLLPGTGPLCRREDVSPPPKVQKHQNTNTRAVIVILGKILLFEGQDLAIRGQRNGALLHCSNQITVSVYKSCTETFLAFVQHMKLGPLSQL